MKQRSARLAVASLLAAVVMAASGCVAPPGPTAAAGSDADGVPVDQLASLDVSPVEYDGFHLVTAIFSTVVDDRPVSLQRKTGLTWENIASGRQDSYGETTFHAKGGSPDDTYRAVAEEVTSDGQQLPAVATGPATVGNYWQPILSSDFNDGELDPNAWNYRLTGSYEAKGRQCAAPYKENVTFADGAVQLGVNEDTDPAHLREAKNAGCGEDKVYSNAMISTEQLFTMKTGMVAARVKFPPGQGMHGAVWLQSYKKFEIDFVEAYGHGVGLTSVIHVKGKRYPAKDPDTYINVAGVNDKSRDWWSQYHVFSVEWDTSYVIFRIDGVETRRLDQHTEEVNYFLVISNLTSDWEHKRFIKPVQWADGVQATTLPQSMSVDWVRAWKRG